MGRNTARRLLISALTSIYVLLTVVGCASVPREVVELSYTVGRDLSAVHQTYRTLIERYFDLQRSQINTFIDMRWRPVYLQNFIKEGDLVGLATERDPNLVLEGVGVWVEVAIEEIEAKRSELIVPLDRLEQVLLRSVDEAFGQLVRANSLVTAHLNSLRKVQEVQDEVLGILNVKDIRDAINDGLIKASEITESAIRRTEEAEGLLKAIP